MSVNINIKNIFKKNFLTRPGAPLIINSKFSILFPHYQEKNFIEKWFIIQRILRFYDIKTTFDSKKGEIGISTTNKTLDPYSIINAKDFLRLLSRGVPVHQAAKIFNNHVFCDIVKISGYTRNKKIFLKRRKRIIGNNGSTIKVIELLTKTFILIQGNTVSCVGNFKNIQICRKIIEDCMTNIHPFIHIRNLVIKKKLLKSIKLKNKSWKSFVPLELVKKEDDKKTLKLKIRGMETKHHSFQTIKHHSSNLGLNLDFVEIRNDFKFKNIKSFITNN